MKFIEKLITAGATDGNIRFEIKLKLILIFMTGSLTALVINLLLGSFGLDFSPEQMKMVILIFLPIMIVLCLLADVFLILYFERPIDKFLENARGKDGTPDQRLGDDAFSRAINLPLICVLRVELVHLPIGLLSILMLMYFTDAAGIMDFSSMQYFAVVVLGLMNATIHSIIEYYLVSRFMKSLLEFMHGRYKHFKTDGGGIVFVNAKAKFYFIYLLIAVMPLIFLGSTLLFKTRKIFVETGISSGMILTGLLPWTVIFILVSSAVSFLMAYILSRETIDPVNALTNAMKKVEKGIFTERLLVTTADEFSGLFNGFNTMTEGLNEREIIKRKFGKYVSNKLLSDILGKEPELGGDEKTVTILFSDIRNYTGLSESMSPSQTVAFLNEYFSEMVKIIEEHNGLLDKFIGDAVMAVFGAPVDDPAHAVNAISAALRMREQLAVFNTARKANGFEPIEIGIGISSGKVLVGNIGSETRMEYTVIGDAVNLASRIETLTKETGAVILFSDSTRELIKDKFTTAHAGRFDIKGKSQPCDVFTIKLAPHDDSC